MVSALLSIMQGSYRASMFTARHCFKDDRNVSKYLPVLRFLSLMLLFRCWVLAFVSPQLLSYQPVSRPVQFMWKCVRQHTVAL